jgi:hypothetical protein
MTNGCVHLLCDGRWKFHQLAAGQLSSRPPHRYRTEKAGGTARPSCTKSHLPGRILQLARRAAMVGQTSSLRAHWLLPWLLIPWLLLLWLLLPWLHALAVEMIFCQFASCELILLANRFIYLKNRSANQ